jgi:hypothetical protein
MESEDEVDHHKGSRLREDVFVIVAEWDMCVWKKEWGGKDVGRG